MVLYASDGSTVLNEVTLKNTGSNAAFKLAVPDGKLKRPGPTAFCVKSLPAEGVAASSMTKVTVRAVKTQTISAPKSVTLTNLKTAASLKAKASSKLGLIYKSSNPKVVTVNSKGKLTRKKNGKATITISQKGNGTYQAASKKVTVRRRSRMVQSMMSGYLHLMRNIGLPILEII